MAFEGICPHHGLLAHMSSCGHTLTQVCRLASCSLRLHLENVGMARSVFSLLGVPRIRTIVVFGGFIGVPFFRETPECFNAVCAMLEGGPT